MVVRIVSLWWASRRWCREVCRVSGMIGAILLVRPERWWLLHGELQMHLVQHRCLAMRGENTWKSTSSTPSPLRFLVFFPYWLVNLIDTAPNPKTSQKSHALTTNTRNETHTLNSKTSTPSSKLWTHQWSTPPSQNCNAAPHPTEAQPLFLYLKTSSMRDHTWKIRQSWLQVNAWQLMLLLYSQKVRSI